eukprot:139981-Chlamydomonas_euryale.AAC.2
MGKRNFQLWLKECGPWRPRQSVLGWDATRPGWASWVGTQPVRVGRPGLGRNPSGLGVLGWDATRPGKRPGLGRNPSGLSVLGWDAPRPGKRPGLGRKP